MSPVRESMSGKKGAHSTATATSTPTPTSSTASNPPATPFGAPTEAAEDLRKDFEAGPDPTPPDPDCGGPGQTANPGDEGRLVDQDNVSLVSQVKGRCMLYAPAWVAPPILITRWPGHKRRLTIDNYLKTALRSQAQVL